MRQRAASCTAPAAVATEIRFLASSAPSVCARSRLSCAVQSATVFFRCSVNSPPGAEPERVIAIYHGHDASIAVSVGGEVRCVLELERLFGVRFYRLPDENEDLPAFRDDLTAALGVVRDRCLAGESTRFHLAVLQAPLLFLPRVLHDAGFVVERWAYVDHATAHAASAFYASPFSSALTIVSDGTMSKLERKTGPRVRESKARRIHVHAGTTHTTGRGPTARWRSSRG